MDLCHATWTRKPTRHPPGDFWDTACKWTRMKCTMSLSWDELGSKVYFCEVCCQLIMARAVYRSTELLKLFAKLLLLETTAISRLRRIAVSVGNFSV